jgi:hypothetical protein
MLEKLAWVVVSLALLLPSGAALAQGQTPQGQLWALHQETVKPSMVAQYEAASKEFVAAVSKYRPAADFGWIALASEQYVYTFVTPIKDWNGLNGIEQAFMAVGKKMGMEKWMDLWKRGFAPVESVREVVAFEPAGSGYRPASPRLKDEEIVFFHYDFYYVMPGHEEEADAVARDFAALFKKKNIPDGYRLYKALSGPELPLIVVQVGARDGADYYASNARALAALGEEGQALFARAFAITRRFDSHNARLRLDLSLPPPAPAAPK